VTGGRERCLVLHARAVFLLPAVSAEAEAFLPGAESRIGAQVKRHCGCHGETPAALLSSESVKETEEKRAALRGEFEKTGRQTDARPPRRK